MKSLIGYTFAIILTTLQVSTSHAATVNTTFCTGPMINAVCITGIEGLDVGGILYDVTLDVGSFDDVYPVPGDEIPFWGSESAARNLAQAINNAAGGVDADGVCYSTRACFRNGYIAYAMYGADSFYYADVDILTNSISSGHTRLNRDTTSFFSFEVQPAAVPIPAAFWLMFSSLSLLGFFKRKSVKWER